MKNLGSLGRKEELISRVNDSGEFQNVMKDWNDRITIGTT
jgi:hypothetical protein